MKKPEQTIKIAPETYEKLLKLKEKTKVPIKHLVDRAVSLLK